MGAVIIINIVTQLIFNVNRTLQVKQIQYFETLRKITNVIPSIGLIYFIKIIFLRGIHLRTGLKKFMQ